jgi:hypothetical protein
MGTVAVASLFFRQAVVMIANFISARCWKGCDRIGSGILLFLKLVKKIEFYVHETKQDRNESHPSHLVVGAAK